MTCGEFPNFPVERYINAELTMIVPPPSPPHTRLQSMPMVPCNPRRTKSIQFPTATRSFNTPFSFLAFDCSKIFWDLSQKTFSRPYPAWTCQKTCTFGLTLHTSFSRNSQPRLAGRSRWLFGGACVMRMSVPRGIVPDQASLFL